MKVFQETLSNNFLNLEIYIQRVSQRNTLEKF